MTATPIRLLLLEDNEGDARLVQAALAEHDPGEFALTTVERLADALARIGSEHFDVVLCDLGLPDSAGVATAEALATRFPGLPLVVLTGSHNEDLGREAIRHGAQDYLVKGESNGVLIARTLRYAIERKHLELGLRTANEALERRVGERTADLETANRSLRASEARHRAITQTATDAIVTADAQGNIAGWNAGAERLFGYTETEALGQALTLIIPERYRARHLDGVSRVQAGGERHVIGKAVELHGLNKAGSEFPLELSLSDWETPEGRFFTAIIHDITVRKHAQEAILRENEFNHATLENLPGLFYLIDEQGRFLRWNRNFEVVSGYSSDEIAGLSPMDFFAEPDKEVIAGKIKQVFLTGAATAEADFVAKDQTRTPYFFNGRRVQIDRKPCLIGMGIDITERKVADAKLGRQTQLYAALSESNKAIVHCATEEELFSRVCRAAVDFGGMKMAWIGVVDPDTRLIRVAASFGDHVEEYLQGIEISMDGESPLAHGPTGTAIRENQPYWCQDFQNDPATDPWRERGARAGWAAVASLPLRRNGVVIGAFVLYSGVVNGFDEPTRDLLVEMAGDISFGLDNFDRELRRRRAKKDLQAAEERFRGLVEQSIAGIYIIQDGKLAYVNPRFAEILGYGSAAEVIGREALSLVVENDRARVGENIRKRIAGEVQSMNYSVAFIRKDGSTIDIGIHGAPAAYQGRPATIGLMQDISEKKRAEEETVRYTEQLKVALLSTVEVATAMSELRDPYTAGHQRRVAQIAVAIGAELGLDAHRQEGLKVAGQLHDIGKITVPSEILSKPGKLTRVEFQLIQQHPQAGYDVLKGVQFPWPVAEVAHQHHERLDGSGYPQGLKGEAILLEARIMAVADIVEAMSSHRPYRQGLGIDAALAQLKNEAGTKLDAEVVAACERLFREKGFRLPG